MSTPFDPVADALSVFSAALGQMSEVSGAVVVRRALAALDSPLIKADPTQPLGIASKEYVDAAVAASTGTSASSQTSLPIYRRDGSGLITQIFAFTGTGPGPIVAAFPQAFPNACTNLIITDTGILHLSYGAAPGQHTTGLADGGGNNAASQFTIWSNAPSAQGWVAVILAQGN